MSRRARIPALELILEPTELRPFAERHFAATPSLFAATPSARRSAAEPTREERAPAAIRSRHAACSRIDRSPLMRLEAADLSAPKRLDGAALSTLGRLDAADCSLLGCLEAADRSSRGSFDATERSSLSRLEARDLGAEPLVLVLQRTQRQDQAVLSLLAHTQFFFAAGELALRAVESPLRSALEQADEIELGSDLVRFFLELQALRAAPLQVFFERRHALEVSALAASWPDESKR
jgi:hypothetical protein